MEMVMAGNSKYLTAFQDDIRTQRFDLIITDPLFDSYKGSGESWAEENNVWVDAVSLPILCHYWRKVRRPFHWYLAHFSCASIDDGWSEGDRRRTVVIELLLDRKSRLRLELRGNDTATGYVRVFARHSIID